MSRQKVVKELFVLRAIACLSVVLLHAIGIGLEASGGVGRFEYMTLDSIKLLLYYGTPLFIFISEFVLAYSYRKRDLPINFLRKRVSFIFVPYIIMALFYSIPYTTSLEEWGTKAFLNIFIGDYHGYFILIIFQFYILHLYLHKHMKKWRAGLVLMISFFINVIYLAIFNLTESLHIPYGEYIWERFYWVPFLGWIFYFSLGFYCGQYYVTFMRLLIRYKRLVLVSPVVTACILLFFYHSDLIITHSSKRIDMLIHTPAVCFFLIYVSKKLNKVPAFLVVISQYSFGIYLLHMCYQALMVYVLPASVINNMLVYVLLLTMLSTFFSMVTVYYANRAPFGKYAVGKIGIGLNDTPTIKPDPVKIIKRAYRYLYSAIM